jgi:hypothetical protein
VYPRAGLDDVEERKFSTLPGLELRPLGRPARSLSLYRLSYPDSAYFGSGQKATSFDSRIILPYFRYVVADRVSRGGKDSHAVNALSAQRGARGSVVD